MRQVRGIQLEDAARLAGQEGRRAQMRIEVVEVAVNTFLDLQAEHADVIQGLGLDGLVCLIRQKGMDSDNGWACYEIGLEIKEGAFWGKFVEKRGDVDKRVQIFIDCEDIDSIEFEVYDQKPVDK